MGRPSKYSSELAAKICEQLAGGHSLISICEADDMPGIATVLRWLPLHKEFREDYARARETWAEFEFENMMRIADTPLEGTKTKVSEEGVEVTTEDMLGHRSLQVATRKWVLARMAPKKYGDKILQELTGADGAPLFSDEERDKRLAALLDRIAQNKPTEPTDASDLA